MPAQAKHMCRSSGACTEGVHMRKTSVHARGEPVVRILVTLYFHLLSLHPDFVVIFKRMHLGVFQLRCTLSKVTRISFLS